MFSFSLIVWLSICNYTSCMDRNIMKSRLLCLCLLLLPGIKFCCGKNVYCNKFKNPDTNEITFTEVISNPNNKTIPILMDIVDSSALLEQNDSRIMIDQYAAPTSLLFFSVGDTAEIIVKNLPDNVFECYVYRKPHTADGSYEYQYFEWDSSETCSFIIPKISSEHFGRWRVVTMYQFNNNMIPTTAEFREDILLMDATKDNEQAPFINDNPWQISNRTIYGVMMKIFRRLEIDRDIAIKPHAPSKKYNSRLVKMCEAIHYELPKNKTYHIAPPLNHDISRNSLIYTGRFYSCEFKIPVLVEKYLGRWDIITYFNDTNNYENGLTRQIDMVEILEMKTSSQIETFKKPKHGFHATAGSFVLINHLNECYPLDKRIKTCKLINKKTKKQYILTENNQEMKLMGKCGVRMRVLRNNYPDHIDYWQLEGSDSNGRVVRTLDFAITVVEYDTYSIEYLEVINSNKGTNITISPNSEKNMRYWKIIENNIKNSLEILDCELQFPNGTITSFIQSNCSYTFNITSSDSITLRWFYSFEKSVEVTEFPYFILINGSENIVVNEYSSLGKKYVRFEFNDNTQNTAEFCQFKFINNNSSSIQLQATYEYGGCRFVFDKLTDYKYGLWIFSISYNNSHNESYHVVNNRYIEKNDETQYRIDSMYQDDTTHVIFGDKFMVNCSQNVPLEFCRLTNPVKIIYSTTNETLLRMGKCEILVESADYNHHGPWSCELFNSGRDISTKSIKISRNFYVVIHNPALSLEVHMNPKESRTSASILCANTEQLYSTYATMNGCWWIQPDGQNISQNLNDLTIVHNQNTCKITFNRLYKEDFGLWKCVREYVMPDSRVTLSNSIELIQKHGMIVVKKYSVSCYVKHSFDTIGPMNTIDCEVSPKESMYIRSCHWIRPDKTLLFPNVTSITAQSEKYNSSVMIPHHPDTCSLHFNDAAAEDIGNWTCLINLTNSYTDIITGTAVLYKPAEASYITNETVLFIVLGSIFLVVFIFFMVRYEFTYPFIYYFISKRNTSRPNQKSNRSKQIYLAP